MLQRHLVDDLFGLQNNIEGILQSITPDFMEIMKHITFEDTFSQVELGTIFMKMKELSLDIEYFRKSVKMEGTLKRNIKGQVFLDNIRLRPLEVIEIWVYVDALRKHCWVKTYLVGNKINYLAGVSRLKRLTGIKARKRDVILTI